MRFRCSIGVVTYLGRFETYFKPLIKKLNFLFPDYDINVFINGHYDTVKQIQYLRNVTTFLRKYPAIRYLTNINHQPLARGWNWLIMMALQDSVLILNDDVFVKAVFRYELEHLNSPSDVFMINGSWSHFVIDKRIIRKVGWFDERYIGVGDEDGDYICRLAMEGIPLADVSIRGLENYVTQQESPGWAPLSGVIHGKYARVNREFFVKKWWRSDYGPVPEEGSFYVRYKGEEWHAALRESPGEMPEYYPKVCLDNSNNEARKVVSLGVILAKICSFSNRLYWLFRLTMGRCARRLLGPRWDKWRSKIAR